MTAVARQKASETLFIAGASARAAVASALRAGLACEAADLFGDTDLQAVAPVRVVAAYPQDLLPALSASSARWWIYTGALENHPALVEQMAGRRPLLGNGAGVLRAVRCPFQVHRALCDAGLPALSVQRDPPRRPDRPSWLCKPLASSGGTRIHHWPPEASAADAEKGMDQPGRWYFQQYRAGPSCSGLYVGDGQQAVLLGVTRQLIGTAWCGAVDFVYAGSVGPLSLSRAQQRAWSDVGDCLAARFGLKGLFGVDAIMADGQVWPVEVNPRYTASVEVLERATGCLAIKHHIAACRDQRLPDDLPASSKQRWGKVIVYGRCLGQTLSRGQREILTRWSQQRPWPQASDIPGSSTAIPPHAPVCTLFARGETFGQITARLRHQIAELSRSETATGGGSDRFRKA